MAKGDVVNLQIYACRMLIKKKDKGREEKVIKGGKRSERLREKKGEQAR